MIPNAEKFVERAQKGEQLTVKERRHAISYLTVTRPELTGSALAQLFKVSEPTIRIDKQRIREAKAEMIQKEDIGLVIADIAICFERQIRDMESSKNHCKVGSVAYLGHCKAIFQMQLQKVEALQKLGYYPQNLGNLTVQKFEYKAIVNADGSVLTRPMDMKFNNKGDVIETTATEVPKVALPVVEPLPDGYESREAELLSEK